MKLPSTKLTSVISHCVAMKWQTSNNNTVYSVRFSCTITKRHCVKTYMYNYISGHYRQRTRHGSILCGKEIALMKYSQLRSQILTCKLTLLLLNIKLWIKSFIRSQQNK